MPPSTLNAVYSVGEDQQPRGAYVRIEVDDDDVAFGEKRPIMTEKERFQWVQQTYSLLGKEGFYEESLYSCALESWTAKRLGVPRKDVDDTGPDYHGVEVTSRAAHYWADGRPYVCSRVVSKHPHTIKFLPTLTGFRVPTRERVMDLRYFVEPEILTLDDGSCVVGMNGRPLFLRQAYTRASGITRWQVDLVAAVQARADIDVWTRFERAVRAGQAQHELDSAWVEACRARRTQRPPRPTPIVQAALLVVKPRDATHEDLRLR